MAAPLSVINTFTLQETLFIEQLTAIDERVRFQVRENKMKSLEITIRKMGA